MLHLRRIHHPRPTRHLRLIDTYGLPRPPVVAELPIIENLVVVDTVTIDAGPDPGWDGYIDYHERTFQ